MPGCSDLVGLPVLAGGRRLGQVRDLLLDGSARRVTGLVLDPGGWFRPGRVLDWQAVAAVGDGAVLAREPRWTAVPGMRWSQLAGRPVLGPDGQELGVLADLQLNPAAGAVAGYQLSCGLVDDLLRGQPVLAAAGGLEVAEAALFLVPGDRTGGEAGSALPQL